MKFKNKKEIVLSSSTNKLNKSIEDLDLWKDRGKDENWFERVDKTKRRYDEYEFRNSLKSEEFCNTENSNKLRSTRRYSNILISLNIEKALVFHETIVEMKSIYHKSENQAH